MTKGLVGTSIAKYGMKVEEDKVPAISLEKTRMGTHRQIAEALPGCVRSTTPDRLLGRISKLLKLASGMAVFPGLLFAVEEPYWWPNAIRENDISYFYKATGKSDRSQDDALQQAQSNALAQIVDRVGGRGEEVRKDILTRIRGWTLRENDSQNQGGVFYRWILLEYPKEEFKTLRSYVEGGEMRYAEAVRLASQRQWQQALTVLDDLVKEYPLAMQSLFRTEKAIFLAGKCYEGLGKYRNAIGKYKGLLNTVSDPTFREEVRTALERAQIEDPESVDPKVSTPSRSSVLELLKNQNYRPALSNVEWLIEKEGQTPEHLELVARCYAGLGNLESALDYRTMAARSSSPNKFPEFRMKAQEMASQVLAARCIRMLKDNEGGKKHWALLLDPGIKDDPDLASFVRGLQTRMAQAGLKLEQKDWLLFEEWLRTSDKRPSDLLGDKATLNAACAEAGVEPADLVLLVSKETGSNKAKTVVHTRLLGGVKPISVALDVVVSQAAEGGATLESSFGAVKEERFDEAATLFEQMGNKEYALLLRDIALLKRDCKSLGRDATVKPESRSAFERSMLALTVSVSIWIPQTESDKRLSQIILAAARLWMDGVEADFRSLGGNKRDLIAVLNRCRELDRAMNLLPVEKRHPNAVRAYAEYAEKYRTCPAWAVPKGVWIDADSGFSLEVEDRKFRIPFRLISGGESYFGDARQKKRVVLSPFYVQVRETTNKDFMRFCDETGWQVPEHLIRNTGFGQPEQPVTHVSHLDAMRYAHWLGNKLREGKTPTQWKCELPTEAQWEASCRLSHPFDYPWGLNAEPTASLAQRKLGAPEDATRLSEDISIADVMGLGGNVWEWCRDGWTENATDTIAAGAKEPVLGVQWGKRKVVKGGCYFSEKAEEFRIFSRHAFEPGNVEKSLGFRVVVNMISTAQVP